MSIEQKEEMIASLPPNSKVRFILGDFDETIDQPLALAEFRNNTTQWQRDVRITWTPNQTGDQQQTPKKQVRVIFPDGQNKTYDGIISGTQSDELIITNEAGNVIIARFANGYWSAADKV